jgi:RNA polymerase sigma factor (sigma-70 family)
MMTDDMALVREYAVNQSEQAFETLVSRHVNLVYSVALRQVRDPHLAEEIAQAVFIILARKVKSLKEETILPGWLCRTALYVCADASKAQRRRQHREEEAHMQSLLNGPESDAWTQIAPLLDTALAQLGEADYNAIVLRFFEGRNFNEVGAALGTSENAAKKRVDRAVEKLRKFFTRRGVTLSAAVIASVVTAKSVQAAPAGLAATISAVALKGSAVTISTLTLIKGGLKLMAWTKAKTAIVGAVVFGLATTAVIQHQDQMKLREQVRTLQQQQASLAQQIQQLRQERDAETNQVDGLLAENEQLKSHSDEIELLRLRAEATRLYDKTNDPTANMAKAIALKVQWLKQRLAEMPEKSIPELRLLTEQDWANAVWDEDLNTDDGIREALSRLRDRAEGIFLGEMQVAFRRYLAANNDVLPAELSQLKPYFEFPVTDDMFQRYQLLQTGKPDSSAELVKSATPYVDADYDSTHSMSLTGIGGSKFNKPEEAVEEAAGSFSIHHNGQTPDNISQIMPYLKTTMDAATIQKYLDRYRQSGSHVIPPDQP